MPSGTSVHAAELRFSAPKFGLRRRAAGVLRALLPKTAMAEWFANVKPRRIDTTPVRPPARLLRSRYPSVLCAALLSPPSPNAKSLFSKPPPATDTPTPFAGVRLRIAT
eukprot:SAG25_NODE_6644_length_542_cov_0.645598_1_plen_108_part_10